MTEVVEKINKAIIKKNPEKYLKVEVLEVDFVDSYKTANNKKTVKAPHWPAEKVKYTRFSKKPATLQLNKTVKADIKVKVDSKGVSGEGVLKGIYQGYLFEGKLPLSSGEKTVSVEMKEPPETLRWLKGNIVWNAEGGGLVEAAGTTFIELFFVFDDPEKRVFFSDAGVWAEALRFLFKYGYARGVKKEKDGVEKVTRRCFNIKEHRYEIDEGAPRFKGLSGKFNLKKYISTTYSEVNCHDQAYAVVVFSGALGLEVEGLYMEPFGFLNLTQLVGRGPCNNPFPYDKYKSEKMFLKGTVEGERQMKFKPPKEEHYLVVDDVNDDYRTAFNNHSYCEYKNGIYDACAGPSVGKNDRKGYVEENIDSTTSLNSYYKRFDFPGKVSDIETHISIGDDVKEVV
ncbi:hypothetical protein MNBD_GAMMA10-2461 [hydrothermal vent metagenome]|uniref:Uncharacterized protein n=1 Tax=hydrothermal vent metagenome TaxID=652676 RepID=A0A3B0YBB6_9ZZZZ